MPGSGGPHVFGARALFPFFQIELNRLTFSQGAIAFHLDFGLVAKTILAPIVRGDDTIALGVVEPFDFS